MTTQHQKHHSIVALLAAALIASTFGADAQTSVAPPQRAASAADDNERDARDAADQSERERLRRSNDQATPQAVGDAPLPPQGEPVQLNIERTPLHVRRGEVSVGFDHALTPQWSIGGLLGYSRGRLTRSQIATVDGDPTPAEFDDSKVHTRSTSVTGTLSYFPQPDLFVDASLSYMHTAFEAERLVNDLALFSGSNAGRQWGLSLSAGKVWRSGSLSIIPQVGLDYIDARVDALNTSYVFTDPADGPFPGFQVGEQRYRSWFGSLGGQVQWTASTGFGTVAPYVRAMWRQRLAMHADPVVSTADGADAVTTDLTIATSRRLGTIGVGVLLQFTGGISAFADIAATRGNADLRESQLSIGVKFER